MSASPQHVLLATAGHVDHGKTRLVARLTGIDTDRLPEEKARGISIDLGFAHMDAGGFRFGVVDVPGHERFVRRMVAGAGGVNVALLVVAADDGVMPQTREHLDVMQLLGLDVGVVAITKTDLVDPTLVEVVRDEVTALVDGTFLETAAVLPVSAVTGDGCDELVEALVEAARRANTTAVYGFFRLPIDRVFTRPGHGTIVTGSALHGDVNPGDRLTLLPEERSVRVRAVESHGDTIGDAVVGRRRTAVNLAGLAVDDVERGMELATPDTLRPTRRLVVRLQVLPSSPIGLRNRDELALHVGTTEVTARIVTPHPLSAGEIGFAELRTRNPVVATFGQRFVLRRPSPALTVAGGAILEPWIPDRRRLRNLDDRAARLVTDDVADRLSLVLEEFDTVPETGPAIAWRIGMRDAEYARHLRTLRARGELQSHTGGRGEVHRERIARVGRTLLRLVEAEITRRHPRRTLTRDEVRRMSKDVATVDLAETVLDDLVGSQRLERIADGYALPREGPSLTKRQRGVFDAALSAIAAAGSTPPTVRELVEQLEVAESDLRTLLDTAVETGLLVRVSRELLCPPAIESEYRRACRDVLRDREAVTLSQLREAWGVTRKWAVPLAEHLDAIGFTIRDGNVRRPGPQFDEEPNP